MLDMALVAQGSRACAAAPAGYVHRFPAEAAFSRVTLGLTPVSAGLELLTGFPTPWNGVLARLSPLLEQLFERRLATWAVRDNVWGAGAVRLSFVLNVTASRTLVKSTVEAPLARLSALEGTLKPGLLGGAVRSTRLVAFLTRELLLDTATVASHIHGGIAIAAESGVARLAAEVLTAGQHVLTRFLTAPAVLVVGLSAKLPGRLLAAEAQLSRSHQAARRTRACMALQRTWMGTRRTRFRASLAA